MNGCKPVDLSFQSGAYLDRSCNLHFPSSSDYTVSSYVNLSSVKFDVFSKTNTSIFVCKYDLNHKMISHTSYIVKDFPLGVNSIDLDPNYVYRFSYPNISVRDFSGVQCNVGIGSMANELAFGNLTFWGQINTIIPFVIPLIAFALGFLLLKKMIKRGNKGHA